MGVLCSSTRTATDTRDRSKDGLHEGLGSLSQSMARFEGEWVASKRHGVGAVWNDEGTLIQCGRWVRDMFIRSVCMPLRMLPEGKFLGQAGPFVCDALGRFNVVFSSLMLISSVDCSSPQLSIALSPRILPAHCAEVSVSVHSACRLVPDPHE